MTEATQLTLPSEDRANLIPSLCRVVSVSFGDLI